MTQQVDPVDGYEQHMFAILNQALAQQTAYTQQFTAQLDQIRAAWQPVPPQMYAGFGAYLRRWVAYCEQFQPAAEWLAARNRPQMKDRIAAIRTDCATAAAGYEQMAQSASAAASDLWKKQAAANQAAFESFQKMHNDLQAAFDASNAAWLKYFRS